MTICNDAPLYIRFGKIPDDEKSKVWCGEECVGEECGVSVYDAVRSSDGTISVCLPLPMTEKALNTFISLIKYESREMYLVTGNLVGRGTDNEPLLRDLKILEEVKEYRLK